MRKWTNEEMEFVLKNYKEMTALEMSKHINRSANAIQLKMNNGLGVKRATCVELTVEMQKDIINRYIAKEQIKDIAESYYVDTSRVLDILDKNNAHIYKQRRWTEEELNYLRRNYSTEQWDILEKNLNRTREEIQGKAYRIGVQRDNFYWNDEDIQILKDEYNKISLCEIKEKLNNKFSEGAISNKASKLGIKKVFRWEEWEIDFLLSNYEKIPIDEIAKVLTNRKNNNIVSKAKKLGLTSVRVWKQYEDDFITNNYKIMSDKEMALELKRTFRAVKWRRNKLGFLREQTKGEYANIAEYLRKRIKQWKKDSLKSCGFKCVLTGKRVKAVHHLHGFIFIVKETLSDLNLGVKDDVYDYTEEELDLITQKCLELHYKYGLGVCLCKQAHDLFHKEYGYGYNTPEQFQEFVQRWDNKEFEHIDN